MGTGSVRLARLALLVAGAILAGAVSRSSLAAPSAAAGHALDGPGDAWRLFAPLVARDMPEATPADRDAGVEVAFIANPPAGVGTGIYAADPHTGSVRTLALFAENEVVSDPDWSSQGGSLAVIVSRGTVSSVVGLLNPDTGALKGLVERQGFAAVLPRWSPAGRWLVFGGGSLGTDGIDLYLLDAADGSARQLTSGQPWYSFVYTLSEGADWAPDGQRIVFTAGQRSPGPAADSAVFIAKVDGTITRVLGPERQRAFSSARWSVSGSIAIVRSELPTVGAVIDSAEILVLEPDSGTVTQVTHLRDQWSGFAAGPPAWSADGARLAVMVVTGDGPEQDLGLHVMSSSGTDHARVSLGGGIPVGAPAWSPDGRHVAVGIVRPGQTEQTALVIVDVVSGEFREVASEVHLSSPAVWSPGGLYLAYTSEAGCAPSPIGDPGADLYVFESVPGRSRRITAGCAGGISATSPEWMGRR